MMPIRTIFTVVMVGLASTFAVAAAAAMPAAASPVRLSQANAPAAAIVCPYHSGHWTAWYGTCVSFTDHSCRAGAEGNMAAPDYVSNACGNNVDLYPRAGQGGSNPLCIGHDSRTHHLATYRSWRVIVGGCGAAAAAVSSRCPRGGTEVTIYKANCADATALNHGSCHAASGHLPFSPAYVFNGCGTRVWLFTKNLSGTKVCINPGTGNNGAFVPPYHYYQITTNEDNCPS